MAEMFGSPMMRNLVKASVVAVSARRSAPCRLASLTNSLHILKLTPGQAFRSFCPELRQSSPVKR
jgi:hypothetical protein